MSSSQYATRITSVAIVILFMSTAAIVHADTRIRGQVLHDGKPAAGAQLRIFCAGEDKKPYTVLSTDYYGAFRKTIPRAINNCKLVVSWGNLKSDPVDIDNGSSQIVLNINLRKWKEKWLLEIK